MHYFDAEELAMHVLGLNEDSADGLDFDNAMIDKFDVSMEQFQKIAEALMKYTPVQESALTRKPYRGFVLDGSFIVKEEVPS
jgi:hypothetical protein